MKYKKINLLVLSSLAFSAWCPFASAAGTAPAALAAVVNTVAGMPAVVDAGNLYSETAADRMLPAVKQDLERVYVPNLRGNNVTVIDPATLKIVDRFKVGRAPQHIVPSWDMRTLWVANNAERGNDGSRNASSGGCGKPL